MSSDARLVFDASILIVDDDKDILTAGKLLLKRHFNKVVTCHQPENIPKLITQMHFDAILLDMNFGPGESTGKQGFYWLDKILSLRPESVIVMITAHGGVDIAVDAMKAGATDFIAKPWQNEKVVATLATAAKLSKSRGEASQLKDKNQALIQATSSKDKSVMIGDSAAMLTVKKLIERAAPTDANVLILGENGTGKELVARAIHEQSLRNEQAFVSIDLGAVSESLFESELFGHVKGAFTGAQQARTGRILAANGGTLFLDEIGNLPLHLQSKLLTVIEQRELVPVGANKAIPFDVRLIAATNVTLQALKNERQFRQDLLFRLNTVEIQLPTLNQRAEDIPQLVTFFVSLYQGKYQKSDIGVPESVIEALKIAHWAGNIRELRHAIERAIILCDDNVLSVNNFQLAFDGHAQKPSLNGDSGGGGDADVKPVAISENSIEPLLNLEALEKQAVTAALKKYRYNISQSAKALGLTRAALYRRMEKYGL